MKDDFWVALLLLFVIVGLPKFVSLHHASGHSVYIDSAWGYRDFGMSPGLLKQKFIGFDSLVPAARTTRRLRTLTREV